VNKGLQRKKAEAFRDMHQGPAPLVLGSVWDVASAIVFERAGFRALGTSSAGIAYMRGYADGEVMSRGEMLEAVAEIASRVDIPVSADMETGYGHTPDDVAETCRLVLEAGAIGVNIEDTTGDPERPLVDLALQCEKIRVIRGMGEAFGVPIVINARTDGYWLKLWDEERRLAESVARCNAFREAGADCLFVPGAIDAGVIAVLARDIRGPLNILASPGCPPVAALAAAGVRRVSEGSGPARAALKVARDIAEELLRDGSYRAYQANAIPYAEANALFASRN
jgi:2-methylisocitrate lyase-like PEP mutase family enzyme